MNKQNNITFHKWMRRQYSKDNNSPLKLIKNSMQSQTKSKH